MNARRILVLNGPNLDMLGTREPEVYGLTTLDVLEREVEGYGGRRGVEVICYQSNSEGELIGKIHEAASYCDGIVYNPGAHTHYSYALRDAIASVAVPVVEVHLSDIGNREDFRRASVIAPVCIAQVKGMGIEGYCRAIDILREPVEHERLGEGHASASAGEPVVVGAPVNAKASSASAAASLDATAVPVSAVDNAVSTPVSTPVPAVTMNAQSSASMSKGLAALEHLVETDAAPLDMGSMIGGSPASPSRVLFGAPVASTASKEPDTAQTQPTAAKEPDTAQTQPTAAKEPDTAQTQPTAAKEPMKFEDPTSLPFAGSQAEAPAVAEPELVAGKPELITTESEQTVAEPEPVAGKPEQAERQARHAASNDRSASVQRDNKDYAAAFAGAVASVDAGLLSFERQSAVRQACKRLGIVGLLVRDTSNVQWITALDGVFDEERAHALLVAGEGAVLHTDTRYSNAVRSAAQRVGSDIVVNEGRTSHARFAFNALTAEGTRSMPGKLGIEDTITYAEFVKMVDCFKTDGLAPTTEVVLSLRAVKDAGEITRMRAAQAVTDAAFTHIIGFIRPGMTEREVQLELEDFMMRHGAQALAFRSIVATGANGADPHAIPGNTRLEAGQCVVLDFGAKAYGYCSDMTRTVFLGAPEGQMAEAWNTLRRANESVEALLKPGVTGAQAHELAEKVLAEGGFGNTMGHGLGHGVGIDVHELPVLNPRNKVPLVEGNVVTVEPGIYIPGKFGMRLEDFGVVTAAGFDTFTGSTHEMVVL